MGIRDTDTSGFWSLTLWSTEHSGGRANLEAHVIVVTGQPPAQAFPDQDLIVEKHLADELFAVEGFQLRPHRVSVIGSVDALESGVARVVV